MYHMNRNKNSKMNMPTESEQPQPAMSKAAGYIRAVMTALFILYLLLLVYLTLLSDHYNRRSFFRSINFVPFRTITNYLGAKINNDIIVTNLLTLPPSCQWVFWCLSSQKGLTSFTGYFSSLQEHQW